MELAVGPTGATMEWYLAHIVPRPWQECAAPWGLVVEICRSSHKCRGSRTGHAWRAKGYVSDERRHRMYETSTVVLPLVCLGAGLRCQHGFRHGC